MDIGLLLIWQNWHEGLADEDFMQAELDLGVRADRLGFDTLWSAEHHFSAYSMCPDNMQVMAYFAGVTERIRLGTGAVIVPWWDPLRVVEKITLLDHLAQGRLAFGMGRGLAPLEYTGFRENMNDSRERFDEASAMIVEGLRTGVVEHEGEFFSQPRVEIRPSPSAKRSWDDRVYAVAMSPDSVDAAARLGATMMAFMQLPAEQHKPLIDRWREGIRSQHGREPGPPTLTDFVICAETEGEARELAHEYLPKYYLSIIEHYELGDAARWRETVGYDAYRKGADVIEKVGVEKVARAYVESQVWGTPEQILERYARRRDIIGDFDPVMCLSFSGLPFAIAQRSMELLSERVLPELRSWEPLSPALA